MSTTRTHGVTLTRIDLTEAKEAALAYVQSQKEGVTGVRLGEFAFADKDGAIFALTTEGVGSAVTDADPLEIEVYAESGSSFDLLPSAVMRLTPERIRSMAGEQVDLADFIRTFGARLESNFTLWHRRLSA